AEKRTCGVDRKIAGCLRLHLAHKIRFGKARRKVQFRDSDLGRHISKQVLHVVDSDRSEHVKSLALRVRHIAHQTFPVPCQFSVAETKRACFNSSSRERAIKATPPCARGQGRAHLPPCPARRRGRQGGLTARALVADRPPRSICARSSQAFPCRTCSWSLGFSQSEG